MRPINRYTKIFFASLVAFLLVLTVYSFPINAAVQKDANQQILDSMLSNKPTGPSVAYRDKYLGPTETTQYEWPQAGYTSEKSYFSPMPTAPTTNHLLWKTNVPDGLFLWSDSIIVVNGKLICYTGIAEDVTFTNRTSPRTTYALDQNTGAIIWSRPGGGPACKLDDTRILCGSECVNVNTGETLWKLPSGSYGWNGYEYDAVSMRGFGSGPYTMHGARTVAAWDFSDLSQPPELLWTSEPLAFDSWNMNYYNGKVYLCSMYEGGVTAFDADTGAVAWDITTPNTDSLLFNFGYGMMFGASHSGSKFALDAETGQLLWSQYGQSGGWLSDGASCVAYDMLFVPETKGYLYALDVNDGHVVWKYREHRHKPHICDSSPECWTTTHCYYGGHLFAAAGKVYVNSLDTNDYPTTMPDGSVAYPGETMITCLDAFTGQAIWRYEGLNPSCTIGADGKFYGTDRNALRYTHSFISPIWPTIDHGEVAFCFGEGPTYLTASTDKTQVRIGETIKISGSLQDLSPASPNAPAANVPVTLTCNGKTIATVMTDKEGKYTYDWAPPQAPLLSIGSPSSVLSIVASSVGSGAYHPPEDAVTPVLVESISTPIVEVLIVVLTVAGLVLFTVKYIRKPKHGGTVQ